MKTANSRLLAAPAGPELQALSVPSDEEIVDAIARLMECNRWNLCAGDSLMMRKGRHAVIVKPHHVTEARVRLGRWP